MSENKFCLEMKKSRQKLIVGMEIAPPPYYLIIFVVGYCLFHLMIECCALMGWMPLLACAFAKRIERLCIAVSIYQDVGC